MKQFDFLDLNKSLKILWKYYFALGVLFLVVGIIGLFSPVMFSLYLGVILAWYFIFIGMGNIFYGVAGRGNPNFSWGATLFMGILELLMGLVLIFNPMTTLYLITVYIGILLIFKGFSLILTRISIMNIDETNMHMNGIRTSNIVKGVLDIFFGILVITVPFFAMGVFGYMIVFYLILGGLSLLITGCEIKKALKCENNLNCEKNVINK